MTLVDGQRVQTVLPITLQCFQVVGPGKDVCRDLDPWWCKERVVIMIYVV